MIHPCEAEVSSFVNTIDWSYSKLCISLARNYPCLLSREIKCWLFLWTKSHRWLEPSSTSFWCLHCLLIHIIYIYIYTLRQHLLHHNLFYCAWRRLVSYDLFLLDYSCTCTWGSSLCITAFLKPPSEEPFIHLQSQESKRSVNLSPTPWGCNIIMIKILY